MVLGRRSPRERSGGGGGGGDGGARDGGNAERIRVFGVGLGRTGTRSLTAALNRIGWHCLHQPSPDAMLAGAFDYALQRYDAATDSSVAVCFRRLAETYPCSKFILTVRDRDSWLRSCSKKFAVPAKDAATSRLRELLYGAGTFNRETWLRAAERHISAVLAYFSGSRERRKRLLVMDIASGANGWRALCNFLTRACPQLAPMMTLQDFPHITTHLQHLRSCEFSDTRRKIGLVVVRHGRAHYGAERTHEWHTWVRRRLLIVVTRHGNVWFFLFRRPDTPLSEWEAAFRLPQDVGVHMQRLRLQSVPRQPLTPEYELRVDGLIGDAAQYTQPCTLHFGCNDIEQLLDWRSSVLAGCEMAAGSDSPDPMPLLRYPGNPGTSTVLVR